MAHEFEKKWRSKDVQLQENVDFSVMLLNERVLSGLTKAGYKKPSPIQLEAIPVGRVGKDLLVQAKSGTGKTLVFTIIALEQLKRRLYRPQALILAPTREIATQINKVIQSVGSSFTKLKCCSFIGGLAFSDDKENALTCQIVVGTPGRIRQLIKSGYMPTTCIRLLVFDEADQLLQGTFKLEIDDIFNSLPKDKQVIATSATYPARLRKTIFQYFREPHLASLNSTELALLGIVHYTKVISGSLLPMLAYKFKLIALEEILSSLKFSQCLIFCNGIARVEYLCLDVKKWGYTTTYISSAKVQTDRLKAMDRLKNFKCKVFISSDVSSRGIDAENVDLVINFDIPYATETYLHRVGRAGRYGSIGVSISLLTGKEISSMEKIEAQGTFKSYKLPDPLPSDLIQNPYFGEYTIPESACAETEEREVGDDKETKADGAMSNVNGMPFEYNFIDFNKLSNKKQKYVNDDTEIKEQTIPDVTDSDLSTNVDNSTDVQLNVAKLNNESDNLNPNGSHSDDDILVLEKITVEKGECGVVSEIEKLNEVKIIENFEISSNEKGNLIDSLNSVDEDCINTKYTIDEKICISDSNATSNSTQINDSEDLAQYSKAQILNNDAEQNKLNEIASDKIESSSEFKNMENYCDISNAVDRFILNFEKNKDLSSAFQDEADETTNDKNSISNLVTPNMIEKLKQNRSNYLYEVFKCYQNESKKNYDKEFNESGENSINENKKESTPVRNNSDRICESVVNEIEVSPMQPEMNKIANHMNKENDADSPFQNSKSKLGNTLPKFNKLYSSDSESDSEFISEQSNSKSVPVFVPQSRNDDESDSSSELSCLENDSESSYNTSSMNRGKNVHKRSSHRFHKSCNNGMCFNDCSTCTKKSVCCNRNMNCCSKQASSSKYKCTKASQYCYGDSYTARNMFQNQSTRSYVPNHNCHQTPCCSGSVPNDVNCHMPSEHRSHMPCCSCTYSTPAVCNMWHDTFMYQWFHVQRCINSSVWH